MKDDCRELQRDARTPDPDKIFFRVEAARYLTEERKIKTSPKSLGKYACHGGGPRYRLFGQRAAYTRRDLDAYADSKITPPRKSTSERTASVEPEQVDLEEAIAARSAQ